MKSRIGSFFTAFWMCYATAHLSAQPEEIISRYYSMRDGLSHNYATCLLQDSQGLLWVGTESGLNKFDGYQFTIYQENPLDSNSLSNNNITCLWEEKQQRLWVGSTTGLELFDLKTGKFQPIGYDALDPVKGLNIHVHKIRERKDGKLWICTSAGIYLADPQTLSMTKPIDFSQEASRNSSRRDNLNGNNFWDIAEAPDGSVWAASEDGLVHMHTLTGQTTRYRYDPAEPASLADDWTRAVHVDRHDRVWVGTVHGLDLFNPEDQSFTHFLPEQLQTEPPLSHRLYVNALLEQPDGTCWVGFSDGLYAFDPETGRFDLLLDHYVWSMYKDRQENLWLGTIDGLFQIAPQRKKFTTYRKFGQAKMSGIASLAEDVKGQIWISGYDISRGDFKLFRFEPSSRRFFPYPDNPLKSHRSLASNIQCMTSDSQGWLWMASPGTLEKFNPQCQTFTSIALPIDPTAMVVDSKGKVWIGEWNGVGRYDPQTETYERLTSFPTTRVYSFLEDQTENIWIGSEAGLIRYNLKTDQLHVFKHDPADPQSLSNNKVYHLMMDQHATLWIGTGGGLNKMISGSENNVPKFIFWRSSQSGLPYDDVYRIIDGGDETLWISCGNSISHFFPQKNTFRNYDYDDGLPSQRFSRSLQSSDGNIYFGSDGLVVFHPDSLQDNPYPPPVAITGFSIHNQPVPVKASYEDTLSWETPLTYSLPYTDEVELTHQQNDFSLEFAALNFVNPESNRYKYKLEPYEENWIEASANNRIARYTNISPGRYTFRVMGSNNDGVWNEQGASLQITILPPWWQTGWAYGLYTLIGICMLYGLRQYTVNRERLKNDLKIKQIEAEKLQELDHLRAHLFANISHEFRTPLTLILSPLEKLLATEKEPDTYKLYQMMRRNANRLLHLISQLLDLSKLEAQCLKLETKPGNVMALLQPLAASFTSLGESRHIHFSTQFLSSDRTVFFDADKLEKMVVNLLSNAFKFTPEGGCVLLQVSMTVREGNEEDIMLEIVVKDTGMGLTGEEQEKIFDRFYQADNSHTREMEGAGIGLAFTKELVSLHGGNISVRSQVGEGSSFTVELPLRAASKHDWRNLSDESAKMAKTRSKELLSKSYQESIPSVAENVHPTEEQPVLLIVEDNEELLDYMAMQFQADYQVIKTVNGKMGLQKAIETIPDLVVSDVMMPVMDGIAFSKALKADERISHIPLILLTAKAGEASKLEGLQTGADDYLTKPFNGAELQARIKNLMEGRKRLRERFGREITLQPGDMAITSADEKFLQRVMAIMADHLEDTDFTLESFEKAVALSHVQFYRKLKALTNHAPGEFLRHYRLQQAAILLKGQQGNVSEVAYAVGFNSLAYFTRCFKGFYRQTPSEYQAAHADNKQAFIP